MADELRDLRAKITVHADITIDSFAKIRGIDRSEVVREILHRWALDQMAIATLLNAKAKAEGM